MKNIIKFAIIALSTLCNLDANAKSQKEHIPTNKEIAESWLNDKINSFNSDKGSNDFTIKRVRLKETTLGCNDLQLEKDVIQFMEKSTESEFESFALSSERAEVCPLFEKDDEAALLLTAEASGMSCIENWSHQGKDEHLCYWIPSRYVTVVEETKNTH